MLWPELAPFEPLETFHWMTFCFPGEAVAGTVIRLKEIAQIKR
jgi:hypothetical protein